MDTSQELGETARRPQILALGRDSFLGNGQGVIKKRYPLSEISQ